MDNSWTPMNGNEHQLVMHKRYVIITSKYPENRSFVTWYGSYFLYTALGTRGDKINLSAVDYFKIRVDRVEPNIIKTLGYE
jgi:hypothetical protein